MTHIQVFITLKITDNIARTALHAVQTRMNYPELRELRRSEFWELHFPELDSEPARKITENFVTRTSYFMNPNKHVWSMVDASASAMELDQLNSPFPADARMLICDLVDGKAESTQEALQALSGQPDQPAQILHGVLWDLSFDRLSPDEIRKAAEDLAVTRSRTHGLFANPHYQRCRIFC
ncbi:MAG: hypothetical protein ACOX5R_03690 [bacterium]|jgi:phosphoribosylformylglycinamidine (FGAM) synthase PurS component